MGGRERIVAIDVAKGCKGGREIRVVLVPGGVLGPAEEGVRFAIARVELQRPHQPLDRVRSFPAESTHDPERGVCFGEVGVELESALRGDLGLWQHDGER